ncbi:glycoside hydrolase [Pedobacter sp. BMA]|uniref:glycoside hydrolase n=1 Tax=Pedobacter sp. BMA TaxID=1663685 RepID=UPI000649D0B7|nr:glycoside hydrolase [Pedobacter sp. BMA]KLT66659.1 beta-glycosidase [Pedobacter sp. BMA]
MKKILFVLLFAAISYSAVAQYPIPVQIDFTKTAQTIENIGASGCWFSEGIGKYWPEEKKQRIAELLFSKEVDPTGKLKGIGLSSWRFNIGAGSLEQADSSGIKDFRKRTDGFLNNDGTYNWDKQAGYRFFLQKAKDYGVETLIAFSNSPPVQFTKNHLSFKTEKDYQSNLRDDAYGDYARFLTEVIRHFEKEKIHFDYISPVNEPQWDWSHKFREADQEGSPWTNEQIFNITKQLNNELVEAKLNTRILVTEAGMLNYLYGSKGKAAQQIQSFFNPTSAVYMGNLSQVPKLIGGHSYFTEDGDSTLYATRNHLADTASAYKLKYWQTEYSMLGDGFREGIKADRSAIDCALFLAKVIHADLTTGNATAWQFWNAYEPGSAEKNTRYYLIALKGNPDFKDGSFTQTKNLWALGHFSRFIRPGMVRLDINAGLTENKKLLVSAYTDQKGKVVIVAINQHDQGAEINMKLLNNKRKYKTIKSYRTTGAEGDDMKLQAFKGIDHGIALPARSITTILME